MPRDLALGNGHLLVTFDASYTLRDIYYPHVGKENHTIGHPCRTGVWVDGRFAWLSDPAWTRRVAYREDSLVSDVQLEHPGLQLRIHASDAVHPTHAVILRSLEVTNLASQLREVRLFFHHDFHIAETDIGDTAYYEPVNGFLAHYKGGRYFLISGRTSTGQGIFQYATGTKEVGGSEGTWRDAEDGWLEMNPMAQGSVDSTISFRENVGPGRTLRVDYWIAVEKGYWEAKALNELVRGATQAGDGAPAVGRLIDETDAHWRAWLGRTDGDLGDLPAPVRTLYRRSLLVIGTQIDHDGAIIAANDGDSMLFNRDTYSYMWPRDAALVARTLDLAGYRELSERFFRFCTRLMPRPSYYPDGHLLHKFNADGSVGSSWHPWVRDGRPSLPIQEDETALVLWSLWHHYQHRRRDDPAVLDLVRDVAPRLILPAARFMLAYRDVPEGRERFHARYVHPPTGLPLPSYDLWEERYGVHTFTVAATCAGLDACGAFAALIGEQGWGDDPSWRAAAGMEGTTAWRAELAALHAACGEATTRMRAAMIRHLWAPARRSYGRMLTLDRDGDLILDETLDAATMYALLAFGVFPVEDAKVRDTIATIEERLWCKTSVGGVARYENDYYHRQSDDIANVPGSPWFICTLWCALGRIALARSRADLQRPREILEWVCRHAQPSGVLAEQVHPYTGAPMSVSPLTWSHAAFVETVHAYRDRLRALGA